ncbi:hypothetical protein [Pseudorhodoferax sp.]|uniref:hypothetical protein n=1 Tax=Pseudorhodoferax sp. TaxID=1993553 RepID=UPI0039E5CABF
MPDNVEEFSLCRSLGVSEFDTNCANALICIGHGQNAPLQKGELGVERGLLALRCGQRAGLLGVDGDDAGDRRGLVDAHLLQRCLG